MADFRPLMETITGRRGGSNASLHDEVLLPWIHANSAHIAWLREFGQRTGAPIPHATQDELWDLYSISRVNELLLLSLQPGEYPFPARMEERLRITLDEYTSFMTQLGFRVHGETSFTPVFHEIVEVVEADDPNQPVSFVGEYWPLLMLGDMVFSRAGVLVKGGTEHIVKDVAEHSTMFWAWCRRNRPALDLSHGWGSNSQWRTDFRRDYVSDGQAYLNVDARTALGSDDLSTEQRRELLLHRCFVRSSSPESPHNLWPYNQTAIISCP